MRIRRSRLLAGLVLCVGWLAAWGCYSSNAVPPTIEAPEPKDGSDLPIETVDACTPRKLWEGPGITAVLPTLNDGTSAYVISGDRYAVAEFDVLRTDSKDPAVGQIVAWRESGLLRTLWEKAPPASGSRPWDSPGVTAAYIDKSNAQIIINQYRRWVLNGGAWTPPGTVQQDLVGPNDAGPPVEDGGRSPWADIGVTAAAITADGTTFSIYSRDRYWVRVVGDPDPTKQPWLGTGAFMVSATKPWMNFAPIAGKRPWDDKGITAVFYIGVKLFTFSGDKLWVFDGDNTVIRSGLLEEQDGWKSAPAVGCQ